ncbi:MAG TPA: hypothetical protein VI911_08720 [Patescibacteria group bacterium]|nr:MAG: hypothetical protein UR43_C0005G0088 [candidate division TM6 bacterium GW2011_GWF2_33_332]HLD91079.1 hypothetical protein [Patescibacteria group bacterium]
MSNIIGIGGKAKHGKDSIANVLIDNFGYKRISLADPLKKILYIGLKEYFTLNDFYDQNIKDLTFDKYTSYPELVLTKVQIERIVCAININYNLTGVEMDIIREWFRNEKFYSLRDLMQRFGTDLCRNLINKQIWILTSQKQINHTSINSPEINFVISDIRFPEERQMVKNLNGLLLLVKRDLKIEGEVHTSEQSLGDDSEYNTIIHNTSTLEDLEKNIIKLHKSKYPLFK